ncbi:hypothetical protein [Celeribacter marinus]|uniref:hypothetical protein n=1 Tax=Celeribacter marinus TaxID=1397108 RepID=UPI003F6B991F
MRNIQIIETVTFHSNAGVTDAQLHDAAIALETYFARCDGFYGRLVFKTAEGLWMDQMLWADQASAQSAHDGFMADPAAGAYVALIDHPTMTSHITPALFAAVA